jgi:Fungal specific transcription factor domain.
MQSGNDDFCSSVLVNAILAVGSLFYEPHDQFETRHDVRILGEQFMEEADRLIQEELIQGRSSLTSMQALVIMSMRDVAAGKEAIMWFHLGLATMMAINLALDMDTAYDTSLQKQCGRITYWGLFGADRYVSYIT